jgi:hypothetical protein
VDERVELLAIIFRLAGAEEYRGRHVGAYADAIDVHFGSHGNHAAVEAARQLRQRYGIGSNAVADLAVHVSPLPQLVERLPLEKAQLDPRWTPQAARDFLQHVRAFARDSDAVSFFSKQRPLYAIAERRMRALIANETDLQWVRSFYGGSGERFIVVPALGNGTLAYGPRFSGAHGEPEYYAIMGVWQVDEDEAPNFDVSNAPTIIHEFSHSYVTPLILENYDELRPAGEALLAAFRPEMTSLGYPEGSIILHESIIRAGVARYKLAQVGEAAARRELERQRRQGFIWIDELYDLLGRYEQDRRSYPTFREFYPTIYSYYGELPTRLPTLIKSYEARRPQLVELSPTSGASNVDPATRQITVRFDRPMQRSWGFNPGPANSDFPMRGVSMTNDRTTVIADVQLQPNTDYEILMNPGMFLAEDGTPLRPRSWRFRTGPARTATRR